MLEEVGVRDLYRHQKEAVRRRAARQKIGGGGHSDRVREVLTYAIPLMSRLGERRSSRAMILFRLKALANDQLAKLRRFVDAAERLAESGRFAGATLKRLRGMANVTVRVCDGDTSEREREMIRSEKTQLILTNPDCLHHYSLPGYPKKWTKTFWQNLEWVVVDEAHVHRGVAGSHFANVLRRVLRLCAECDNRALRVRVHERHDLESGSARARPHHSRPGRGHNLGRARGREGDGAVAAPRTEPADADPGRGGLGASSKPLRGSRRRGGRVGSREGAVPVLRVRSKTHRGHRARRQGATGSGGSAGARAARRQLPRGVQGGGETRLGTSARRGGGVRSSAPRRSRWASTSER